MLTDSNIKVGLCQFSFLVRKYRVFLFLHMIGNLGLYPGLCEWHLLETLDSIIFVPLLLHTNFRISLLISKKQLTEILFGIALIHRSVEE